VLLAVEPPLDVADALLEPQWLVGPPRVAYERIAQEFADWTDDDDLRVAAVGRLGMSRFADWAAREDDDDDDLGTDAEWG